MAVMFLKDHAVELWTNNKTPKVVANLTWTGFMGLLG
jgi:hypothetical protein